MNIKLTEKRATLPEGRVKKPHPMNPIADKDIILIMSLKRWVLSRIIPSTKEPETPLKMNTPPKMAL